MWANNIRKKTNTFGADVYTWLKKPLCDTNGSLKNASGKIITHEDYVNYFLETIETILRSNAYQIHDINKFREDILKYVYTLSDNY